MKKQIYSSCSALFSLALLFGIVMTSCKQEILPIKVESVTLDITSLTMSVGETMSLTATISPSDAENQKVLWSTSNANVATVKDGTVSAIAPGEATVTVKTDDGGKTAECTVTVKGANEGDGTEEDDEDEDENKWPIASVLGSVTATTVQFDMTLDISSMSGYQEAGLIFSPVDDLDVAAEGVTIFQLTRENYSKVFTSLNYNTTYYYTTYLKKDGFYLYGEKAEFTTSNVLLDLSVASSTATTAQITGTVEGLSESDKSLIEVGMFYSSESGKVEKGEGTKLTVTEMSSDNAFSFDLIELAYGTTYYYCSYVKQGDGYIYGEVKEFVAGSVSVNLTAGSITATTAQITGIVEGLSESDKSLIEVGLLYSSESGQVENGQGTKLTASEIPSDNAVSFDLSDLMYGTTYYYCSYVKQGDGFVLGEIKTFVTGSVSVGLSNASSITATTAQITGSVVGFSDVDKSQIEVGMYYSPKEGQVEKGLGTKLVASEISSDNSVAFALSKLTFGTTYYYCSYVKQGDEYIYGEVKNFVTGSIALILNIDDSSITYNSAIINANVSGLSEEDKKQIKVGLIYSTDPDSIKRGEGAILTTNDISESGRVSFSLSNLTFATYYFCPCLIQGELYIYNDIKCFSTPDSYTTESNLDASAAYDLSLSGCANSYIISETGLYKFKVTTGNINALVGDVASCSILWESFGTDITPSRNALINSFCYKDNYIVFETSKSFKEGNAVIAANDVSGKILWSWHIWFTDVPQEHSYVDPSIVVMDRNLGATSATPGDVGALGLFYQWGRKDPFLGSSSISPHYNLSDEDIVAKSTIKWPEFIYSTPSTGTIEYAIAHPTTIIYGENTGDWCYSNGSAARWTTSENAKSIYDPCPSGWRVPDGGEGRWSKVFWKGFSNRGTYDSDNRGLSVLDENSKPTWFPASGQKSKGSWNYVDGWKLLHGIGDSGHYWSSSSFEGFDSLAAKYFSFSSAGASEDYAVGTSPHAGFSVRCVKEE